MILDTLQPMATDLLAKFGPDMAYIRGKIFDLSLSYPNEEDVWRKIKKIQDPRMRNLQHKDFRTHYNWCKNNKVRAKLLKTQMDFLGNTDRSTEQAVAINQKVMSGAWDWLEHLTSHAKREICRPCEGKGTIGDSDLICNLCEGKGYQLNYGTAAYSAANMYKVILEANIQNQELSGIRSAKGVAQAIINIEQNNVENVMLDMADIAKLAEARLEQRAMGANTVGIEERSRLLLRESVETELVEQAEGDTEGGLVQQESSGTLEQ